MGLQKFANNAAGTTTTVLAIGGTTFTLQSGEGAEFPTLAAGEHCYVRLGTDALNEVVKVTARAGDVFTCVATTLGWAGATPVALTVSKQMLDEFTQVSDALVIGMAIARMRGAGASDSGVITATGDLTVDDLKVVPQGSPNMTVKVKAGACIVLGVFTGIPADIDIAIPAPPTNNRYTILQINTAGVISKKNGTEAGSPTVPTVDAGNYKVATVLLSTSHTDIDSGDITDNRNTI